MNIKTLSQGYSRALDEWDPARSEQVWGRAARQRGSPVPLVGAVLPQTRHEYLGLVG